MILLLSMKTVTYSMKNLTKYNLGLNTIGIALLLLIIVIEYYNEIVLNNNNHYGFPSNSNLNTIFLLLRISLWKIHFISGIVLSLVFLIKGFINKSSKIARTLFKLSALTLMTGAINISFHNNITFSIHLLYSIIASVVFIVIFMKEIKERKEVLV